MPLALVLLAAVAAETAVLVAVGAALGVLPTLLLLVLTSAVGGWLLRRQGARTLRALELAVRSGRAPHRQLVDGAVLAAAGLLVLLPGLLSDALALLLLVPALRARAGHWLVARLSARARRASAAWPGFTAPTGTRGAGGADIVDVTDFTVHTDPAPAPRPASPPALD